MTRPPLTQDQVNRLVADCHFGLGPTADAGLWMRQELERCWLDHALLHNEIALLRNEIARLRNILATVDAGLTAQRNDSKDMGSLVAFWAEEV